MQHKYLNIGRTILLCVMSGNKKAKGYYSIKVRKQTYEGLISLQGFYQMSEKKKISIDEIILRILSNEVYTKCPETLRVIGGNSSKG